MPGTKATSINTGAIVAVLGKAIPYLGWLRGARLTKGTDHWFGCYPGQVKRQAETQEADCHGDQRGQYQCPATDTIHQKDGDTNPHDLCQSRETA